MWRNEPSFLLRNNNLIMTDWSEGTVQMSVMHNVAPWLWADNCRRSGECLHLIASAIPRYKADGPSKKHSTSRCINRDPDQPIAWSLPLEYRATKPAIVSLKLEVCKKCNPLSVPMAWPHGVHNVSDKTHQNGCLRGAPHPPALRGGFTHFTVPTACLQGQRLY